MNVSSMRLNLGVSKVWLNLPQVMLMFSMVTLELLVSYTILPIAETLVVVTILWLYSTQT